jgi:hypothetical protein
VKHFKLGNREVRVTLPPPGNDLPDAKLEPGASEPQAIRSCAVQLRDARAAQMLTARRRQELHEQRQAAFLAGDEAGLDFIDSELLEVAKAAKRQAARVQWLETQENSYGS